jgi:predicted ATPase/Tfp pilus assembly protein PilF/DNA-binding XRE family transcriptional regulator
MQEERRAAGSSDFGMLLRRHRLAAALSQHALAERAGISSDGISNLERGYRRTPQRETLARLVNALALNDEQRRELEASAARAAVSRLAAIVETSALPLAMTSFVGRETELDEIASLVREHRLVTLTGTGGIGKTQTALRVARAFGDAGQNALRFVGLAPVDPSSVLAAIAAAAGVQEAPNRPLLETLIAFLKTKPLLLILDNCEHVITQAATLADALLAGCPRLRILATSREPLRASGECTYRLASLGTPSAAAARRLRAKDLASYGSIALFTDRARAVEHRFALNDENAPIVADLCRRLDGIPLAIELAAARVDLLSVKALAERLDKRFWILTSGERVALPRQQTMRATIEWSYDLLLARERRLFEYLSVFSGGCSLEAIEAVMPDETIDQLDVVDLLLSLAEKSLVVADLEGRDPRYRLLELTRAFASEKLAENGNRSALLRRHAEWVAGLADRAWAIGPTNPVEPWVRKFEPELENARSAFDWALSAGEVSLAAGIACGFAVIWRLNHGHAEPRRWLEAVLPRLDATAQPVIAARAWRALATVTSGTHKIEAAGRALELNERHGFAEGNVASLYQMGLGFLEVGCIEDAETANDRALRLCQESGSTRSLRYAIALDMRARVAARRDRVDEARQYYTKAFSLMTALGDEHEAILIRINMGELEYRAGHFQQALEFAESAVVAARRIGSRPREMTALTNSAACRLALGDLDGARTDAREALALGGEASPIEVAVAIQHLATVAALGGGASRGARLSGYVDEWYRSEGCERALTERRTYEILMTALRENLTDAEIEPLAAEGARFSEEQAVIEALTE